MNAFADLEAAIYAEPEFYIEPTDKALHLSEANRVAQFRQLLRIAAPSIRIVGIPNAAKRGQWALNQARKEGAAWGFPDLMALAAGKVAFLEFKSAKGRPKQHQIDWLNTLQRDGFPVGVFRSAERAAAFLRQHGFPFAGGANA